MHVSKYVITSCDDSTISNQISVSDVFIANYVILQFININNGKLNST